MKFLRAPLCPAGHLPHRWGDWLSSMTSPIVDIAERQPTGARADLPPSGEMSGRTQGGATERLPRQLSGAPHEHP
ncbi:hypothetical protein FJ930_23185 [Mesorhizobium sp. B2-4-15]|nr:hypothetical protein FJ930_23185 [Mesorhizobium sp. B2-4-15]